MLNKYPWEQFDAHKQAEENTNNLAAFLGVFIILFVLPYFLLLITD